RKTFYSAYYKNDEHLCLIDSKGTAGLGLADILVDHPQWPGDRSIEIGRDVQVRLTRGGKPLVRQTAQVRMGTGLERELTTDEHGAIDLSVVEYRLGRETSNANEPYARKDNESIQISVQGATKEVAPKDLPAVIAF